MRALVVGRMTRPGGDWPRITGFSRLIGQSAIADFGTENQLFWLVYLQAFAIYRLFSPL